LLYNKKEDSMNLHNKQLSFTFILSILCLFTSYSQSHIKITTPSVHDESSEIWKTINDIHFFNEYNYDVNLPKQPLIDSLIELSNNGSFDNRHFALIYNLLESNEYNKENYDAAIKKITLETDRINSLIEVVQEMNFKFNFKKFNTYEIILTLYGPGGSYDYNNGKLTLFTNLDGGFKSYSNPTNTIIHEIIHMGIEESIIQELRLSHALKEDIVDQIVLVLFEDILPDYKAQKMSDIDISESIKTKDDIINLQELLKKRFNL
jgi:hypothetical protein